MAPPRSGIRSRVVYSSRRDPPSTLATLRAGMRAASRPAYGASNYRSVPYQRAPGSTMTLAKRARSAMAEKKGMDTDVTLNPVVSTTNANDSVFVLNLIQQGAGSWNRIGRKTLLKSVRLVGMLNFNQTPVFATGAGVDPGPVRLVFVWDKQPSGAAIPAFDVIFGITSQTGVETCPDITCPPRYDNMDRFRVVRDLLIDAPDFTVPAVSAGTAPSIQRTICINEYIKLPLLESVYSGQINPMTIADISTGALYLYIRSYRAVAGQALVNLDATCRLRFTD